MIFCVAFFPEASHVMVACTTLKLGKGGGGGGRGDTVLLMLL